MSKIRKKSMRLKHIREKYKKCFYCKGELVYYPLKKNETIPDNYATIEHLNSKLQYPNGRPEAYGKARTLVVACYKCNNERGNKEQANLTKEELWERSGRPPLGEDTCQRCIGSNPVWFASNDLWNKIMRPDGEGSELYDFLCPNCFIELADEKGKVIWKLTEKLTIKEEK